MYRRLPEPDELIRTPAVPSDLSKKSINELQGMKNSLTKDGNDLESAHINSRHGYYHLDRIPDYIPHIRKNKLDLQRVKSQILVHHKQSKQAKSESLAIKS